MMKSIDLARLALKNLFSLGAIKVCLFWICVILGLPLLVAYIDSYYGTWNDFKENGFWVVTWQVGLFFFFWLREMLELTIKKNPKKLESQLIERNYIYCSVLLFICYLMVLKYSHNRGGPDPYEFLFFIINCGFIISGIALTIGARKRKPIFWMLMAATLMAVSYFAIPIGIALFT